MTNNSKDVKPNQGRKVLSVEIPHRLDELIGLYHEQLNVEFMHSHGTLASRTDAVRSLLLAGLRARGIVSDDETEQEADATEATAAV